MPIIIPDHLPAEEALRDQDGINVLRTSNALHSDIRSLRFAILNLMPSGVKKRTERQFARLLGHTPLHVDIDLLLPVPYEKLENPEDLDIDEHLAAFYKPWEEVQDECYDGLIVTGAPVEHLDWDKVRYWKQLKRIIDWSRTQVTTRIFVCWGAQAALKHLYDLEKRDLPKKAFGVFSHTVEDPTHPLVAGFDDEFYAPVSRHTEIPLGDLLNHPNLHVLSKSAATGAHLVADTNNRDFMIFNHPEYGKSSLDSEYRRDIAKGLSIDVPPNYYLDNNPDTNKTTNKWRAHARLLYANILQLTFKNTPFNREDISSLPESIPYHPSSAAS